jgi:hypothetical protein
MTSKKSVLNVVVIKFINMEKGDENARHVVRLLESKMEQL